MQHLTAVEDAALLSLTELLCLSPVCLPVLVLSYS